MANIKTNTLTSARRGLDNTSSKILHEIYCAYPKEIPLKEISKKLEVVERTIQSSIKKINQYGVPIEYKINKNKEKIIRANIKEPISWILKEKIAAENMLSLFESIELNGNEVANNKKIINKRIYTEYLNSLNDLFDKWSSLRLFEKLDQPTSK
ncbi:MAG: hypothetical protein CMG55_03815 [Candidatus Marinimicrobia bacterium]|nr:hypothetical protein [Candidatus Neomarinimicrobiota bacterium]|tara:strand:- start:3326 stop:3787 length:462 start_codon:yes stop_codon:yes gene_type:complete